MHKIKEDPHKLIKLIFEEHIPRKPYYLNKVKVIQVDIGERNEAAILFSNSGPIFVEEFREFEAGVFFGGRRHFHLTGSKEIVIVTNQGDVVYDEEGDPYWSSWDTSMRITKPEIFIKDTGGFWFTLNLDSLVSGRWDEENY